MSCGAVSAQKFSRRTALQGGDASRVESSRVERGVEAAEWREQLISALSTAIGGRSGRGGARGARSQGGAGRGRAGRKPGDVCRRGQTAIQS